MLQAPYNVRDPTVKLAGCVERQREIERLSLRRFRRYECDSRIGVPRLVIALCRFKICVLDRRRVKGRVLNSQRFEVSSIPPFPVIFRFVGV